MNANGYYPFEMRNIKTSKKFGKFVIRSNFFSYLASYSLTERSFLIPFCGRSEAR